MTMKKLLLCMAFIMSTLLGCQKETTVLDSVQAISTQLSQDQDFINYFKGFESLALKIKNIDSEVLKDLSNAKDEHQMKEIIGSLNVDIELNLIAEAIGNLRLKYGENLNESAMLMAAKNSPRKLIDSNKLITRERQAVSNLRRAPLPCTTVLDVELVAIGSAYAAALYGCAITTAAYPLCVAGASATALIATAAAYAMWDSCMADVYGHY